MRASDAIPRHRRLAAAALVLLASVPVAAQPRSPAEQGYFDALAQARLVEPGAARREDLEEVLRETQELLVAGEASRAAARLYLVVEGARWAPLAGSDAFQDAEYQLGVALLRGGAVSAGRTYLERLAARKGSRYAEPALRRLVDVALERHDEPLALRRLAAAAVAPLPGPAAQELDYLRGRAFFDARSDDEAETSLRRVGQRCRFYSSAVYLRGVMAVRRGDLRAAQDAFCVIAEERPDDPLRFVIDGRYFTVRDLARLALGRIAHEERRYDDAFYHYFVVPSDSRELPRALFEAAWSKLEQKQYALAGRLVEELLAQYPDTSLRAEARLLRATLQVKTCRFAAAQQELAAFLAAYEPVERAVAEARRDVAARAVLARRLLAGGPPAAGSIEERFLPLLSLSPAFHRVRELAQGLRSEAAGAAALEASWAALGMRLAGESVQPLVEADRGAAALLEQTHALGAAVAGARELAVRLRDAGAEEAREQLATIAALEERRARLGARLGALQPASRPAPVGEAPLGARVEADRVAAASLRGRAAALLVRLEAEQGTLLQGALGELEGRLQGMLRHARLGTIDAVVGEKKRMEREIQDLAAGRFPAAMSDRLHIEGFVGDDEEYWPPEGERWADEYEDYR